MTLIEVLNITGGGPPDVYSSDPIALCDVMLGSSCIERGKDDVQCENCPLEFYGKLVQELLCYDAD